MIALILCTAFCAAPGEAEALVTTAPTYLAVKSASDHIRAAREAAVLTGTDPALLLAIAWHESRYVSTTVTREPRGVAHDTGQRLRVRWSCGVMTPTPNERCAPEDLTLDGGYLAGARHLREWMDLRPKNLRHAVSGYAGSGWRAARFGYEMIRRAAWIRSTLAEARGAK